jgi:hypothetical protein
MRNGKADTLWHDLEGRRVEATRMVCLHCGGHDGVLRQHWCKDELELYCDYCEKWTGERVRYAEILALVEPGARGSALKAPARSTYSSTVLATISENFRC